ncbi:hypothetical protein [Microbacterium terricola]|uniref:Glycosyl hydrolase family 67 C-terminus n=1 Tax=Microbacterium terricola TaxID=344163 RepID=A0ABM8DWA3_9MICO|nr:hypothetical protein [Microbacterium terricola]UYK39418.1 hypothetical protein OAU46_11995 [Microbacterium terricola]BDV29857.1 hypothetical protein Microterr_05170 [Microbacterium terricola]
MTTARRRGILAVATAMVLVAVSVGVGVVVGDALGIRTEPSAQMTPADPVVPAVAEAVAPPEFTSITVPDGARYEVAVAELRDAVADAPARVGQATLAVTPPPADGDAAADDYRVTGDAASLVIDAGQEAGAVRAIYDLAAAIRAGRAVTDLVGEATASALSFRMADLGAVGVDPDPAQWVDGTDYSHVSRAFEDVYLEDDPYIDQAALAEAYDDWDEFLGAILSDGYNAVAWPGFVEFTTFAGVDGVYPDGDPHVARALALREAFGPFWDRAQDLGVKVFLRTDMPTLTPELEDYLVDRFGSLDTENPELWSVYTAGLHELYEAEPALSGILIRIGEGGEVYQEPGWDYYSAIAVRTTAAVRTMLDAYTAQAEQTGREVVFRTWSVGIGDVGDMHTDAASYHAVLEGLDSPALIVSTKFTLGDFYSWLPLNDTLATGDQRRIVEFQSRREFEAFGSFANDLGPEYQWALQTLLADNPQIEGIWTWTQDGGPWRAGPMSLYLKAGFWQLYSLNTQVSAALARDPGTDVGQVTVDWAREWFSSDPRTVTAIAEAMALSRQAITQGLYLEPFAEQRTFAIGLEPPPQMWLFEWDILTGDSATLDVLYAIIGGDRVDETIALGKDAVATAEDMLALVEGTDPDTWHDPALREAFTSALAYEADTLRLLASYREMFLRQAQWHDTGSADVHAQWETARDAYMALADEHLAAYQGDVDHPAWNLTAAELGVQRADRDLAMAWTARVLLVLALAWLFIGMLATRTSLVGKPGAAAARASWVASTRPWRARESTLGMLTLDQVLILGVPAALLIATRAVQTSFLSWTQLAVVLGAWAVFALIARLLLGSGRSPWPLIASVGGVVVLRCIVTLFALSFTGPGGYWFAFWTDPVLRVVYIAVAFSLFVWVFIAAGWAMSVQIGRRRATGVVLGAVGAGLAVPSLVVAVVGLEQALTVWNDQMGLLPWGLSRILGITTYLEIPGDAAWVAFGVGLALAVTGVLLSLRWGRRDRV